VGRINFKHFKQQTNMTLKGTMAVIMPTQQVSDKFAKRDFVIKTDDEKYPQEILVQVTQDKCALLDNFSIGDKVEASINLRGRAWVNQAKGITQYFNTVECWQLSKVGQATQNAPATAEAESGLPF
jgi:hypothetical protein